MATQKETVKEYYPSFEKDYNSKIIDLINHNQEHIEYSHKIRGRWENHYLGLEYVPEIKAVLSFACKVAIDLTPQSVIVPHKALGFSMDEYWFNIAKPGESTGWHDHKEKAELSGVYYLAVPHRSGDIKFRRNLKSGSEEFSASSKSGKLILFDSKLEHSVTENNSDSNRISLAFNLYTLPLEFEISSNTYSTNKFYS